MSSPEPLLVRNEAELSDEGSERAVLATLMLHPTLMVECSTRLKPEDFVNKNNSYLYTIMLDIFRKSSGKTYSFDTAYLLSLAVKQGAEKAFMERSGGDQYIEFLNIVKNTMVSPESFEAYMARVYDFSVKRQLLLRNREIESSIFKGDRSPEELMVYGQNRIENLFLQLTNKSKDFVNLGDLVGDSIEEARRAPKKILGIRTLYRTLDETIEGLRRGTVMVVCAPRKTGKTAFLMNIGVNVAIKQRIPTLMISTEMSDKEIRFRVISNLSEIEEKRIQKGDLNENDLKKIRVAQKQFEDGKFYHITIRQFTVETVIGVIRKFVNNKVGYNEAGKAKECLVIFDYIKMPQGTAKDDKEFKILGAVCDSLKALAGDLEIPILTACQTNRAGQIANSFEITWFCDIFCELTNKSENELQEAQAASLYRGNQRLKITAQRGGEENHQGIDFHYERPMLQYQEVERPRI